MDDKNTIILAIAFIKTYPTLKGYLAKEDEFDRIAARLSNKTITEIKIDTAQRWKGLKNISDIALKNGFVI